MSVRKDKRSLSAMEYIRQAQKILFFLQDRLKKYNNKINKDARYKHLAKSTFYSIWNAPLFDAELAYKHVQLANMIKIKDSESYNKRLTHLNQASQNLKLLESDITTLYEYAGSVIKDKFLLLLTQMIDTEYVLIDGVKKSDAKRFKI